MKRKLNNKYLEKVSGGEIRLPIINGNINLSKEINVNGIQGLSEIFKGFKLENVIICSPTQGLKKVKFNKPEESYVCFYKR